MYYEVPQCAGAPQMMSSLSLSSLSCDLCHHRLCRRCRAVVVVVDDADVYQNEFWLAGMGSWLVHSVMIWNAVGMEFILMVYAEEAVGEGGNGNSCRCPVTGPWDRCVCAHSCTKISSGTGHGLLTDGCLLLLSGWLIRFVICWLMVRCTLTDTMTDVLYDDWAAYWCSRISHLIS